MLTTIMVKTPFGDTDVKAVIIGGCAVHHIVGEDDGYTVTHVNTGYALAAYSSLKVAYKYAVDVQKWVDLDALSKRLLKKRISKRH